MLRDIAGSSPVQSLIEEKTDKRENKCHKFIKDNWFMLATIIGVCVGFAIAFGVRAAQPGETVITWISMPGDIYLRLLQLTVLPLIASSILLVIASLEPKKNGRISFIVIGYIVLLNLLGAAIGTAVVSLIKPGSRNFISNEANQGILVGTGLDASDVFKDIFYNLFPDNLVGTTIYQYRTEVVNVTSDEKVGIPNKRGTNMIGVLFCAISFGIACQLVGEKSKPFLDFFEALLLIVSKLMSLYLKFTPIGVTFMVAGSVVGRKDIQNDFIQLGLFIATVLTGLAIHFIIINLILFAVSGKNPLRVLRFSVQPYLISFATTSPAYAIPEIYSGLDRYGVSVAISRFVAPICAAIKGDGPAIFITSAALFVTQQAGIQIGIGQIFTIMFLTFASCMAVPNIPSASIVLVVTVISAIGVPTEGAGLLFAMEWFLDRSRSGSSCLSVMYIAATTQAIFDWTSRKHVDSIDEADSHTVVDETNLESFSHV